MAFFVKVKTLIDMHATCYTFVTAGTGPSPCLLEITGLKKIY